MHYIFQKLLGLKITLDYNFQDLQSIKNNYIPTR